MSRIHEALKKAELERSQSRAAMSAEPPVAELPAAVLEKAMTTAANGTNGSAATATAVMSNGFSLDELHARGRAHARWNPDGKTDVFSALHGGHGAEQFRMLRSRLYHAQGNQQVRTMMVTSSVAGEGKTFVAANLARAFVRQADRKILVIDADLRCPRLNLMFGAPERAGLSDYLQGGIDEASVIQQGEPGNLYFIPSGSRVNHPTELLSNGRFKTLLDHLRPAFDWIIIDAPPCLPVADAGLIANFCDGLLFVVRAGFTPSPVILKSRQELKGRNVLGVVLNAVAGHPKYSSYYGSGYEGTNREKAK